MQASHDKTVAELEKRLMEQQLRHEAEIAERDHEISKIEQSAAERIKDIQQLALSEQESLHIKIRFEYFY